MPLAEYCISNNILLFGTQLSVEFAANKYVPGVDVSLMLISTSGGKLLPLLYFP
ncbi:hypothetical protein SDC9_118493 [bioreactor metagenome]|uniref:Uncharacterized protein n=1 Tax=bioreactor metagenome TaxID=1076179 RepID=A0A645C2E6_9ZZZZ